MTTAQRIEDTKPTAQPCPVCHPECSLGAERAVKVKPLRKVEVIGENGRRTVIQKVGGITI